MGFIWTERIQSMVRNEGEDLGGVGTKKLSRTKHIVGKYLRTNFKHYEK